MQTALAELEYTIADDERFRSLVNQAPFMLWTADTEGLCTFVNRPWLEFRGRSMEEETGDGWVEGIHPSDRERSLETYRRALEARERFELEYRLLRADGEYCWIRDVGSPHFSADGRFMGYIGTCHQIDAPRTSNGTCPLTAREIQVLTLVAEGKSTKEVAGVLNISYKTADSHRSRIMEKLGVHETASLVRYAIRQGIVRA